MDKSARGYIGFTISVMVKDGRYKYSLTNFAHHGTPSGGNPPFDYGLITDATASEAGRKGHRARVWDNLKAVSTARADALVAGLRDAMARPATGTSGADW